MVRLAFSTSEIWSPRRRRQNLKTHAPSKEQISPDPEESEPEPDERDNPMVLDVFSRSDSPTTVVWTHGEGAARPQLKVCPRMIPGMGPDGKPAIDPASILERVTCEPFGVLGKGRMICDRKKATVELAPRPHKIGAVVVVPTQVRLASRFKQKTFCLSIAARAIDALPLSRRATCSI